MSTTGIEKTIKGLYDNLKKEGRLFLPIVYEDKTIASENRYNNLPNTIISGATSKLNDVERLAYILEKETKDIKNGPQVVEKILKGFTSQKRGKKVFISTGGDTFESYEDSLTTMKMLLPQTVKYSNGEESLLKPIYLQESIENIKLKKKDDGQIIPVFMPDMSVSGKVDRGSIKLAFIKVDDKTVERVFESLCNLVNDGEDSEVAKTVKREQLSQLFEDSRCLERVSYNYGDNSLRYIALQKRIFSLVADLFNVTLIAKPNNFVKPSAENIKEAMTMTMSVLFNSNFKMNQGIKGEEVVIQVSGDNIKVEGYSRKK